MWFFYYHVTIQGKNVKTFTKKSFYEFFISVKTIGLKWGMGFSALKSI